MMHDIDFIVESIDCVMELGIQVKYGGSHCGQHTRRQ